MIELAALVEPGNVLPEELAIAFLSELDGMIQTDIMLHGPEEIMVYENKDQELILRPPHDAIYVHYLVMMIRQVQQEFEGYNNAQAMVNEKLADFETWYTAHYRPAESMSREYLGAAPGGPGYGFVYLTAYGLAVKHGFQGTEKEWIESLKGEKGDAGEAARMRFDAEREAVQWGVEGQWYDIFYLSELRDPMVEAATQAARDASHSANESAVQAQLAAQSAARSEEEATRAAGTAQSASSQAQASAQRAETAQAGAESAENQALSASRQCSKYANEANNSAAAASEAAQGSAASAEQAGAALQQIGAVVGSSIESHNVGRYAHGDIREELRALADRVNAVLNSDDATLDQLSEIVAYIKSNKTLIDAITTSKVSVADIIDNLTTNAANKPLSAAQGVVLAGRIEELKKGGTGNGSGQNAALTATERSTLIAVVNAIGVFGAPNGQALIDAFNAAWGGAGGSETPDEPEQPTKTLTGISATYSGGDVAVGTAVSALTGVVVTAHYSDGSTATVTGYTLSGSIAEGSNTITVSYGGKTTTFTVTGVAESGGDAVNLYAGSYLKSANIESHTENGNVLTYTPTQNGSSITYTIEGLEADKEYTIFVESTRTDGGAKYTQVSVNTGSNAVYDGKLVTLYPSWAGAGKNYATFTANGKTMYLWCVENGGNVGGTTPTLTVYIYPGALTEKP